MKRYVEKVRSLMGKDPEEINVEEFGEGHYPVPIEQVKILD